VCVWRFGSFASSDTPGNRLKATYRQGMDKGIVNSNFRSSEQPLISVFFFFYKKKDILLIV